MGFLALLRTFLAQFEIKFNRPPYNPQELQDFARKSYGVNLSPQKAKKIIKKYKWSSKGRKTRPRKSSKLVVKSSKREKDPKPLIRSKSWKLRLFFFAPRKR